jgi:H+/Cl- antiporter ClcA
MRKKQLLLEQSVLFISVIKWFFLASCVGSIVGFSTAFFIKILNRSISFTSQYEYYFLLLPVALFVSALLIKYLSPEAKGHGTEKVIESVHKYAGKIKPLTVPVKLLATVITLAAGGSAGKEGPAAQIGAGLSSIFAGIFRFNSKDRRKLIICGISAGFASVFGTPIAGAFFGVEVLFIGSIFYDVIFPSFVAGIISHQVSSSMGVEYFYRPIEFVPMFSEGFFLEVLAGAFFFGICSLLLIESMRLTESISRRIKIWEPYKLETVHGALQGSDIFTYDFILKIVFTCITLSFCGSGGIVTPVFFIGATAGSLFALLMGLSPSMFAAIGMVSLLAGATNTPISASIMAIEFFGPKVAPYAAVSCIVCYLMTGHRSVYPSQVLATTKSPSIFVEKGVEMDKLKSIEIRPRPRSITETIIWFFEKLKKTKDRLFKKKKME